MKKVLSLVGIPVFIIAFLIELGCMTKKQVARMYVNDDSTDVYSTHPSRPFKYGYPLTREQCEKWREVCFNYYGIKNGDVVADIGAASGWLEGAFSVFVDSVTFYVQDIDTHILNHDQLNRVVEHFSALRTSPQTNTFHLVIGTEKRTNLPDSTFDKIIIHNTYHEILVPWKIIEDLGTKLKPNGKIIVYDHFSSKYKKVKHEGCGIKAEKVSSVVDWFFYYGFYLTNMTDPESSMTNYLTFEKDYDKSVPFMLKQGSIKHYMDSLEYLNSRSINSDSLATIQIAFYLKNHLPEIQAVYPSLEDYAYKLGFYILKEGDTLSAKNVFQVNTILYSNSFDSYYTFAEACLAVKQDSAAVANYKRALALEPDNDEAEEIIRMLDSLNIRN